MAQKIFAQEKDSPSPDVLAVPFVGPERGVDTVDDALQGAADIIAEMVSDSATLRKTLRNFLLMHGILKTEGKPGADPSMTCMTLIRSRYPKLRLTGSWRSTVVRRRVR